VPAVVQDGDRPGAKVRFAVLLAPKETVAFRPPPAQKLGPAQRPGWARSGPEAGPTPTSASRPRLQFGGGSRIPQTGHQPSSPFRLHGVESGCTTGARWKSGRGSIADTDVSAATSLLTTWFGRKPPVRFRASQPEKRTRPLGGLVGFARVRVASPRRLGPAAEPGASPTRRARMCSVAHCGIASIIVEQSAIEASCQ
jgi:hypothetical protein